MDAIHGYMLETRVILYKAQFDEFMLRQYQDHRLDRLSLEMDAIRFRIKYMTKFKKDLDKIPALEKQFVDTALGVRNIIGPFLLTFLTSFVMIPAPFKLDDIVDVYSTDMKVDGNYVTFDMVVISTNQEYLEYVDKAVDSEKPFKLFPNEFFRFSTDSYNDAIAKAYPELFENRKQEAIGTGADGDVFVHNFTFQTTEACSLNCFGAGSLVAMADGSTKQIEDIKVGDMVLGVYEEIITDDNNDTFYDSQWITPTEVTRKYIAKGKYVRACWKDTDNVFYPTKDHPFLSPSREWIPFMDIMESDNASHGFVMYREDWKMDSVNTYELEVDPEPIEGIVYNLETDVHTFIVEDLIVHNCTYCYQFNKSPMVMSFDTAKQFIDKLLNDEYGYINRYNSPAIIIEFIGGEPLLQIHLTRKIYEYFLDRCYELNHPWFTMHRVSICSNGLQYFEPAVQDFFKEYSSQISFNISIDGNKELHDACRIQPSGEGSYDVAMAALNHYNNHYSVERNSKMTLAPSNIKYLFDSVVDFIQHGMTSINLNCVFEEGWNTKTAKMEYEQLKKLADYILDNHLENLFIAIFRESPEGPHNQYSDGNHCGGLGSMLAMRPNGQFYPCIRYMPSSVGNNVKDLCIGTVQDGMVGREQNSEVLNMMDHITRRSQSNDICFECPLGTACAWCSALSHTVYGTPGKRPMFICIQIIAESLANVYYWNLLNIQHPEYKLGPRKNMVPDQWALLVIDQDELDYLKQIEAYSMIITMDNQ